MKFRCVNNDTDSKGFGRVYRIYTDVTIGKVYEVIDISILDYLIIDDTGDKRWYPSNRFISIRKERDNKLTQLGI